MNEALRFHRLEALLLGACLTGLFACGPSEPEPAPEPSSESSTAEAAQPEPAPDVAATTLLNPNLAGEDELAAIEGMPAEAVSAILEGRPFLGMLELDAAIASLVDEAGREQLYRSFWVPLDLNRSSREEILLIPGVGDRMAHEFEEYRPYDAMARFRREIGKYVDEVEVERLASYVFVPLDPDTATPEQLLAIPGVGERMRHEIEEYRPYQGVEHFRREIGKYVDDEELARLERYFDFGTN